MRAGWAAAAAVVVAMMAALWAGSRGDEQPAATPESLPAPGQYVGVSAQRLPFRVTVAEDRRTLTLDVRWRCEPHGHPADDFVRVFKRRSVKIASNGGFAGSVSSVERVSGDVTRERVRFAGHLNGDGTFSGTWSNAFVHVTDDSETRCATGDVAFELRRRRSAPGTDEGGNRVVALDGPHDVVVGANRTWVLGRGRTGASLTALDPASGRPVARTPVGDSSSGLPPPGIAFPPVLAAGEGAAWVVTDVLGPAFGLQRVEPRHGGQRHVVVDSQAGQNDRSTPFFQGLAVGLGAVWLLDDDHVLRIDPVSGRTLRSIRLTPARPAATARSCGRAAGMRPSPQANRLVLGAGSVWVASNCGPRPSRFGFLSRIDPRTDRVVRTVALRHAYSVLAAGRAGVWAATATAGLLGPGQQRPALHRIGLRDGRPVAVRGLPEGDVSALGVSGGAVWLTQSGERRAGAPVGALRRLNAPSGRLSTVLRLEQPSSLAIGEGSVWIVDSFAGTLTRVRL